LTIVLFFILGLFSLINTISGHIKVTKEWKLKNYRVEFVENQGFAGGALLTYQLNKYYVIPIYFKHLETTNTENRINDCKIPFKEYSIIFNECKKTIIKTE